jgi:hypothetical protein
MALEVQRKAQDVIHSAQFWDHSDVGLAMNQQNVAKAFVAALNKDIGLEQSDLKKMLAFCDSCIFLESDAEMNAPSKKLIAIAKLLSTGPLKADIGKQVKLLLQGE